MPTKLDRKEVFQIRITAQEKDMLRELAARNGVSMADMLRMYIKRAGAKLNQGAG